MKEDLLKKEWLEADGLGGFAMGTASGIRTRRYHALLQVATTPPTGRMVLVNGFDAWVEVKGSGPDIGHVKECPMSGPDPFTFFISSQCYSPEVVSPNGIDYLESFESDPWPQWIFRLPNGIRIQQEIFVPKGSPKVTISWKLLNKKSGQTIKLHVRPFLSGRDYHSTHHENSSFQFQPTQTDSKIVWQPYPGVPSIAAISNGEYSHQPEWYRNFLFTEERDRGLDVTEDLASPGEFRWDLRDRKAILIFSSILTLGLGGSVEREKGSGPDIGHSLTCPMSGPDPFAERKRREEFPTRLHRAADAYLVQRGEGKTIIAGYPWFTDWGRDTFISLRGLCLAGNRLEEAKQILVEWAAVVDGGM